MPAITAANLTTSNSGTASSYTTASISPTAGRLLVVAVHSEGSGARNQPTLTGNSLTYTAIVSNTSGNNNRLTVYGALTAGAAAGTVAIAFAGQSQDRCHWSFVEFQNTVLTGTNGADAFVQSATANATATSGLVTLAAFAKPTNATYGVFRTATAEGTTPGSGFTEIAESQGNTRTIETEYRANADTTVDASWTTSGTYWAIALELKAPVTGGFFMFM